MVGVSLIRIEIGLNKLFEKISSLIGRRKKEISNWLTKYCREKGLSESETEYNVRKALDILDFFRRWGERISKIINACFKIMSVKHKTLFVLLKAPTIPEEFNIIEFYGEFNETFGPNKPLYGAWGRLLRLLKIPVISLFKHRNKSVEMNFGIPEIMLTSLAFAIAGKYLCEYYETLPFRKKRRKDYSQYWKGVVLKRLAHARQIIEKAPLCVDVRKELITVINDVYSFIDKNT